MTAPKSWGWSSQFQDSTTDEHTSVTTATWKVVVQKAIRAKGVELILV